MKNAKKEPSLRRCELNDEAVKLKVAVADAAEVKLWNWQPDHCSDAEIKVRLGAYVSAMQDLCESLITSSISWAAHGDESTARSLARTAASAHASARKAQAACEGWTNLKTTSTAANSLALTIQAEMLKSDDADENAQGALVELCELLEDTLERMYVPRTGPSEGLMKLVRMLRKAFKRAKGTDGPSQE